MGGRGFCGFGLDTSGLLDANGNGGGSSHFLVAVGFQEEVVDDVVEGVVENSVGLGEVCC